MSLDNTRTDQGQSPSPPDAPRLCYLDQCDWSYLQDGRFPDAEAALRELGSRGEAVFPISLEHFLETGGLTTGFDARISFLKAFPATAWVTMSGMEILQHSVVALAAAVEHDHGTSFEIKLTPLVDVTPFEIELAARQYGALVRKVLGVAASAERISRRTRRGQSAKKRQAHERGIAAFLSGDTEAWLRFIQGELEQQHRVVRAIFGAAWPAYARGFALLHPRIARIASVFVERGLVAPPGKRVDPTFTSCVLPHLPRGFCNSRDRRAALQALWRDKQRRAKVAPPIACVAAVEEAVHADTNYEYQDSDAIDRLHAAYAPVVDVFTCDKRNAAVIARVIKAAGGRTTVVRSGKLDEVVAALKPSPPGSFN